jgi:hypothetical protein
LKEQPIFKKSKIAKNADRRDREIVKNRNGGAFGDKKSIKKRRERFGAFCVVYFFV